MPINLGHSNTGWQGASLLITEQDPVESSSRRVKLGSSKRVWPLFDSAADEPTRLFEFILELNDVLSAQTVDLNRIGTLIRKDPPLARLALHLSQFLSEDPSYSLSTIEEAAVSLGIERLRVLILSSVGLRQWQEPSQPQRFGSHCLTSAMLSDRMACWLGYPYPQIAYLAGFLHPMGRIGPLRFCQLVGDLFENSGSSSSNGGAHWAETSPQNMKQNGEVWCDFGPVFTRAFEQQLSRHRVHLDERLPRIVAAACRACRECRDRCAHNVPFHSAEDLQSLIGIFKSCLPELHPLEQANLAEIVAADLRGLLPFLAATCSEIAGRTSG